MLRRAEFIRNQKIDGTSYTEYSVGTKTDRHLRGQVEPGFEGFERRHFGARRSISNLRERFHGVLMKISFIATTIREKGQSLRGDSMAGISGTKLMALCTVAVGAIYAAGYVYTEPSAQASGIASSAGAVVSTPTTSAGASASGSAGGSAAPSSAPGSASASPSPSPAKVKYKDGTYTGSGSNSYGTLSVAVQIKGGKIAAVQITSYAMHYPSSYIYPQMANQVVSMQTWQVYVVSGATASSYNFAEAVNAALQKATISTPAASTNPAANSSGGVSSAPPSSSSGSLSNPNSAMVNPSMTPGGSIPYRSYHHYHRDRGRYGREGGY